jgi:nucleoside 2-deoxyribosyltransferase
MRAYIAGPGFTPEQMELLEAVKTTVLKSGVPYFSPKDENMYTPGETSAIDVLLGNCNAIDSCNLLVVITNGKDVGTMWEAGYAFANDKPIIYVWIGREPGQKFNLMLAASGAVAYTLPELSQLVRNFANLGDFLDDGLNRGEIE